MIYEPELDKTGLELDLVPDATELNQLLIPIEVYNVFESYMNRRDQIVGSAEEKAGLQLVDVLKRYIPEEEYKPLMHMRRNEWLTQLFKRVRPERRSFSGSRPKISYDQKLVYGELQDIYSGLRRLEQRSSDRTEKQLLELTEQWQRLCQRHAMFSTFFPEIAVTKKIAKLLHYGRRLLYGRRLTRAKLKRESFIRRCPAKFHLLKKHVAFSAVLFVSGGLLCSALVYICLLYTSPSPRD